MSQYELFEELLSECDYTEECEVVIRYEKMTIDELIAEKSKLELDAEEYSDCEYVSAYISECIHEINKQMNVKMFGTAGVRTAMFV